MGACSDIDIGKPCVRCFYCHYVFDDQVKLFEDKIMMLKEMGTFVDTETCLDMVQGKRPIDRQYFHLSFDDGFKNIVTNAAPILNKHGIPSLFFVPTSFVGTSYEKAADYCKRIVRYNNAIELCSWDDLKRGQDMGMEIGSHTLTHACLAEIAGNHDLLMAELSGSKEVIEKNLGTACQTIAWPYGSVSSVTQYALEIIRQVGYQACFSGARGSIRNGGCNPYLIPRHHFEAQWPKLHLRYFACGGRENHQALLGQSDSVFKR
jgi:peptidoglycan/xylan/chitin deacetylase (PgdA/CDA1 family)